MATTNDLPNDGTLRSEESTPVMGSKHHPARVENTEATKYKKEVKCHHDPWQPCCCDGCICGNCANVAVVANSVLTEAELAASVMDRVGDTVDNAPVVTIVNQITTATVPPTLSPASACSAFDDAHWVVLVQKGSTPEQQVANRRRLEWLIDQYPDGFAKLYELRVPAHDPVVASAKREQRFCHKHGRCGILQMGGHNSYNH